MSGLRERKKEQTRSSIIEAAEALFAERGLQEPTMEDIAEAAEVSVGTLYNYFGSKPLLQMAIFEEETAAIVAAGDRVVADPGPDPARAVIRLYDSYLDGLFAIDRRLLLDTFRTGFGSAEMLPGLVNLDLQFLEQTGALLRELADRGTVRPERLEDAALLLYSSLLTVLLFYLTMEAMEPDDVRAHMRRLVETAFRGLDSR